MSDISYLHLPTNGLMNSVSAVFWSLPSPADVTVVVVVVTSVPVIVEPFLSVDTIFVPVPVDVETVIAGVTLPPPLGFVCLFIIAVLPIAIPAISSTEAAVVSGVSHTGLLLCSTPSTKSFSVIFIVLSLSVLSFSALCFLNFFSLILNILSSCSSEISGHLSINLSIESFSAFSRTSNMFFFLIIAPLLIFPIRLPQA